MLEGEVHGTTDFGDGPSDYEDGVRACPLCWLDGTYTPLSGGLRHYVCRRHAKEFARRGTSLRRAVLNLLRGLKDAPPDTIFYKARQPALDQERLWAAVGGRRSRR